MKNFMLYMFVLALAACTSTKNNSSVNFVSTNVNKKKFAILPPIVKLKLSNNQNLNVSTKQLEDAEIQLGFIIQNEIYKYFEKKDYSIAVQDIKYSNNILFSKGLSFESYKKISIDSLTKILAVDAVLCTNTELVKIKINGGYHLWLNFGSPASLLLGAALSAVPSKDALTDKIDLKFTIVETNKIVWKKSYNNEIGRELEDFYKKSIKLMTKDFIDQNK
jgi:hypothetical protein